jgi:hypothetical protein
MATPRTNALGGRGPARQRFGKNVGLLLVIALEANPVAGADDRFEKSLRILRRHHLAGGVTRARLQA